MTKKEFEKMFKDFKEGTKRFFEEEEKELLERAKKDLINEIKKIKNKNELRGLTIKLTRVLLKDYERFLMLDETGLINEDCDCDDCDDKEQ